MAKKSTIQPNIKNFNTNINYQSQNQLLQLQLLLNLTKSLIKEVKVYKTDSIDIADQKIEKVNDKNSIFHLKEHLTQLVKVANKIVKSKGITKKYSNVGDLFTICEDYLDQHSR
ncbi:MAG: hypothetical protein JJV93_02495 [Alphaproteobacteria bacterium]|nr:hypothetical protein [Alphaproteobacteria bacterium]MBL0718101.1 hypothetical protein [Alphaproteobacteria bacterium]